MGCCQVIGPALLKTTFYVHCFFFYYFTASVGSEGTTTGHVVSPCSIMMHHGFTSNEVKCARKQNINYAKQHHTPHCWLPAKVMLPTNSTKHFYWLTHSTPILLLKNIQIYIIISHYRPFSALSTRKTYPQNHAQRTLMPL